MKRIKIILIILMVFGITSQICPFISTNKSFYEASSILYKIGLCGSILLLPIAIGYLFYPKDRKEDSIISILFLLIPLMTIASNFMSYKVIEYTRNNSIEFYEELISCIEDYKTSKLKYPTSLDEIKSCQVDKLSRAKFSSNSNAFYQKKEEGYNLTFEQKISPLFKDQKYVVVYRNKYLNDKISEGVKILPDPFYKIQINNSKWYYYFWY